jgi:peptidyl-prolyl cis-trans isomerase A (cyclophilin A)
VLNALDYSFAIIALERTYMARQSGTYATFDTSMGKIVCRLFDKEAPNTVKNFIDLAQGKRDWNDGVSGKKGPGPLYNGTIFHRVIPKFMIQGGDPSGTGMGGPGYKFADETKGSPHKFDKAGKLAMANSGPNTNGSQFFITVDATDWLTGKHTIFGEVVEGQDVVDAITKVKRNAQDRPAQDIKVNSVAIETVN